MPITLLQQNSWRKIITKNVTNPTKITIAVFTLFITSFLLAPYTTSAPIILNALALSLLFGWANVLSVHGILQKFENNTEEMTSIINSLENEDDEIVNNIKQRAAIQKEDHTTEKKQQFSKTLFSWLSDNKINKHYDIPTHFEKLSIKNKTWQKVHIGFAAILSVLFLLTASIKQLIENFSLSDTMDPNCPCLLDEATINNNRANSTGISAGFLIGVASHFFVLLKKINDAYSQSKLAKNALREEEVKFKLESVKSSTSNANEVSEERFIIN